VGGKEKEGKSLTLMEFEEEERDKEEIEEIEAFRECERACVWVRPVGGITEGRPLPSLKDLS